MLKNGKLSPTCRFTSSNHDICLSQIRKSLAEISPFDNAESICSIQSVMQKNITASPDSKARLKVGSDTYLQTCSLRSGTTHFLADRAFRRPNFHDFSPFFTEFHEISSLNCTQPFHLQSDPSKSYKKRPFQKIFHCGSRYLFALIHVSSPVVRDLPLFSTLFYAISLGRGWGM